MSIYCPLSEALGIEYVPSENSTYHPEQPVFDPSYMGNRGKAHPFYGKKHTEETKKLMSKSQQKRVERGDHIWSGSGEFQGNIQNNRIVEGTHNFLGGDLQRKRLKEGTHIFLSKDFQKQVAAKNKETQKHIVEKRMHNFQNKPTVICNHCGKIGDNSNMKRWHFDNCKKKGP